MNIYLFDKGHFCFQQVKTNVGVCISKDLAELEIQHVVCTNACRLGSKLCEQSTLLYKARLGCDYRDMVQGFK